MAASIETELDGSYQQHLVNLLCCRAKIAFAARASRCSFAEGFHNYQAIEAWASQIAPLDSEWPSQDQHIASLEEQLRTLPLLGRDLARCERDIATTGSPSAPTPSMPLRPPRPCRGRETRF